MSDTKIQLEKLQTEDEQYIRVWCKYFPTKDEYKLFKTVYRGNSKEYKDISNSKFFFFKKDSEGEYTYVRPQNYTINNDGTIIPQFDRYKKEEFDNVDKYYKAYKEGNRDEIKGAAKPEYVYITNNYYKKLKIIKPFRKWFIDIETGGSESFLDENLNIKYKKVMFPNLFELDFPFLSISIYDSKDKKYTIFSYKEKPNELPEDVNYIKCSNEIDLFRKFFNFIKRKKPDVMVAWNGKNFDFPAFKRAEKIFMEYENSHLTQLDISYKDISPFKNIKSVLLVDTHNNDTHNNDTHNKDMSKASDEYKYYIPEDYYWIDFLEVYKKFVLTPRESYSLDMIAKAENLKSGKKVEYEEANIMDLYNNNFEKFIEYNLQDVRIMVELDEKLKLLDTMQLLAYDMCCNLDDTLRTVISWNCKIYSYGINEKKIVISNTLLNNETNATKEDYEGGYVECLSGYYEGVVSYDFESLYPNIQISFNISPETKISPKNFNNNELNEIYEKYFKDKEIVTEEKNKKSKEKVNSYSFSSLTYEDREKIANISKKYNICFTTSGVAYRQDKKGFLPELLEVILKERRDAKNRMLIWNKVLKEAIEVVKPTGNINITNLSELETLIDNGREVDIEKVKDYLLTLSPNSLQYLKELVEQRVNELNLYQNIKKIQANSEYGYLGNRYSAIYDKDMASSVTAVGRSIIKFVRDGVNDYYEKNNGFKPFIYADTDSNYYQFSNLIVKKEGKKISEIDTKRFVDVVLDLHKTSIAPTIDNIINEFMEIFNVKEKRLKMKLETISPKALFYKPKMYTMTVAYSEGTYLTNRPIHIIKGLQVKKSIYSNYLRENLKRLINILLTDPDNFEKSVREFKEEYFNANLKDIAFVSSVSFIKGISKVKKTGVMPTEEWKIGDKGLPIQVRAALNFNSIETTTQIGEREKIKYFYLYDHDEFYVIAQPNNLKYENWIYEKGLDKYVDRELMFNKSVIQPLQEISLLQGIELKGEILDRKFRTKKEKREYEEKIANSKRGKKKEEKTSNSKKRKKENDVIIVEGAKTKKEYNLFANFI